MRVEMSCLPGQHEPCQGADDRTQDHGSHVWRRGRSCTPGAWLGIHQYPHRTLRFLKGLLYAVQVPRTARGR